MRLLVIRHGESSANAEGRLQGRRDSSLSDRGRRDSQALSERLSRLDVAALYTSPLLRARETAEIIARRLRLTIEERPALMERDVGELEGLTREEIRARFPEYVRARMEAREIDVRDFESDETLAQRTHDVMEEIIEAHPAHTVAVVTHGGVIAAFLRQILNLPIVRPGPFAVDNASISTFDIRHDEFDSLLRPRVQRIVLNDTCHLDGLRTRDRL